MPRDPAFVDTTPFLLLDGLAAGLTRRELDGPDYRRPVRGTFVASHIPDSLVVRCRATLLVAPPHTAVSHYTAAGLWGGGMDPTSEIHTSVQGTYSFQLEGVRHHRFRDPLDLTHRHGIRVTGPEQTFCHLARGNDLIQLVAFGDRLLKREVTTCDRLISYAEGWAGQCRGAASAAARFVRPRVDSVPETHVRLLMVLAGMPEPEVDILIRREDGTVQYRIDSGIIHRVPSPTGGPDRIAKLAVEYDGRWHAAPEQRAYDEARRGDLSERFGWVFEVVTAEDLYQSPEATVLRLRDAMVDLGINVPRLSDEWRRHFRTPTFVPDAVAPDGPVASRAA